MKQRRTTMLGRRRRTALAGLAAGCLVPGVLMLSGSLSAAADPGGEAGNQAAASAPTATPIKHLVVIFQENVSFDHYFATYPNAANPVGEPSFTPASSTPSVNGLTSGLLTDNPNVSNPARLDRSQAMTCDQDHGYTAEQTAFDHGLMDQFVQSTGAKGGGCDPNQVMDYYDGNTVTALWNYAQRFSMSDNSYGTTFGPSSPGAVNVTSGNTFGAICGPASAVYNPTFTPCAGGSSSSIPSPTPGSPQPQGAGTMYSDADPYFDVCSYSEDHKTAAATIAMGGENIGDLLNSQGITWGWFQGGFASPGYISGQPSTDNLSQVCTGQTTRVADGGSTTDYIPHHEPFPVLPVDREPLPRTALVESGDRAHRPGQPSVRPPRLLGSRRQRQPARGFLPEGSRRAGRPRRLLRPAG